MLFGPLFVTLLHSVVNPISEVFTSDGVANVSDLLAWELLALTFKLRECSHNITIALSPSQHCLNFKPFVLRDLNEFDLCAPNSSLFAVSEVSEVKDRHSIKGGLIGAAFMA